MVNKNIIISLELDDPRSKKLAEVLGSENCKKIIDYLSENHEASQKDISEKINAPLNTVEYNLKKLLESGIVEKTKNFFWSRKGKKIVLYKLSNKSIIISPKKRELSSKIKSILPVIAISGILSILLRQYLIFKEKVIFIAEQDSLRKVENDFVGFLTESAPTLEELNPVLFSQPPEIWVWFLGGMLISIFIFAIINWRKI